MKLFRFLDENDEFEDDHHDEEHDDDKPWGEVILASFVVQMVTLIGVFVSSLVATYNKARTSRGKSDVWQLVHNIIVPAFAAGALLATAVFLLVPESLELIGGGHGSHGDAHGDEHGDEEGEHHDDEEGEHHEGEARHRFLEGEVESHNKASWKFGASLLGGFMFPAIMHAVSPTPKAPEDEEDDLPQHTEEEGKALSDDTPDETGAEGGEAAASEDDAAAAAAADKDEVDVPNRTEELADEAGQDNENDLSDVVKPAASEEVAMAAAVPQQQKDWGLAMSILAGDFFHNFTDGVFIGTSFLLCGNDVGYTIMATTIYHELAQEIADFALLTHQCGFSTWQALALNFVSGFSIFLGGVVVLASDIDDLAMGVILAISAGVYFYIGGAECVPRAQRAAKTPRDTLIFLVCIVLGAVPIGLVLLNHGHCEAHEEEGHHDDEDGEEHHEGEE